MAACGNHSCGARTDASVECWGYDSAGQLDAPSGQFTTVVAGLTDSCAIRLDSTVACWGRPPVTPAPDGVRQDDRD